MTVEAPQSQAAESALPLLELDRSLAPLRRLAVWGSGEPSQRGRAVPYLEATTRKWVGQALGLDLPAPVVELLAHVIGAVEGYDQADDAGRAERLTSLYQSVSRIDALLGLPIGDAPIRRPRKPRLPDWRVEERVEETAAERAPEADANEAEPEPEAAPADDLDTSPRPRSRRSRKAPEVAPPPPPFWDGRLGAALSDLGLEPSLLAALADAGVDRVGDLLFLPPEATERFDKVHGAGRAIPEGLERAALGGRVKTRVTLCRPDGSRQTRVRLKGAATADLVWSDHREGLQAAGGLGGFDAGERVIAVGRPLAADGGRWELHDCERAFEDGAGGVQLRSYGIDGASDVAMRGLIGRLLPLVTSVRDLFPSAELQRNGLEPVRDLLAELHHRDLERARRRLAFDEAFLAQVGLALQRYRASRDRGLQISPHHGLLVKVSQSHGLELGDLQQAAFEDIKRDLRRRTPMRRVLTGSVGSGRGSVALATAIAVAEGKVQVMVLCPDLQRAEQRYMLAAYPLREGGLVARLVEGEPTTAVRDALGRGEIHVVFGTLELLEANLEFRRLGLVVAEELGTAGKAAGALQKMRSPRPHLLTVPVEPVTPAQALSSYADHDFTVLDDAAPVPKVQLFPGSERGVVYGRAAEAVAAGSQVAVLFPMVKGDDALDIREAHRLVQALEADAFGKAKIGLYHSKMSRDERLRAYEDFERRRLDVLVATSPIEDAPAPGGVVGLVLEQAERFDPVRQERLRGYLRPVRGEASIWCVCGGEVEAAREKLEPLASAEPWDTRATGGGDDESLPAFRWLELDQDREIVWRAREAAHRLASGDPRLRNGWASEVARTLKARWSELFGDDPPEGVLDGEGDTGSTQGRGSANRRRRRRRRKR